MKSWRQFQGNPDAGRIAKPVKIPTSILNSLAVYTVNNFVRGQWRRFISVCAAFGSGSGVRREPTINLRRASCGMMWSTMSVMCVILRTSNTSLSSMETAGFVSPREVPILTVYGSFIPDFPFLNVLSYYQSMPNLCVSRKSLKVESCWMLRGTLAIVYNSSLPGSLFWRLSGGLSGYSPTMQNDPLSMSSR